MLGGFNCLQWLRTRCFVCWLFGCLLLLIVISFEFVICCDCRFDDYPLCLLVCVGGFAVGRLHWSGCGCGLLM